MYQLSFISTASDCDAILAEVADIKSNLLYRKASVEAQINSFGDGSGFTDLIGQINAGELQMQQFLQAANSFPVDSDNWKKHRTEYFKLEKKVRRDREKLAAIDPTNQAARMKSLEMINGNITEADELTVAVNARKTEITNAAA